MGTVKNFGRMGLSKISIKDETVEVFDRDEIIEIVSRN